MQDKTNIVYQSQIFVAHNEQQIKYLFNANIIKGPLTRKIFISSTVAMLWKTTTEEAYSCCTYTQVLENRHFRYVALRKSAILFCRCDMTSKEERLFSKNIGRIRISLLVPLFLLRSERWVTINRTPEQCVAARHDWEDAGAISLRRLLQRITRKA